jgi:mRNA-degrading endonuclease RelE of RelBE toxin-antitoxin system
MSHFKKLPEFEKELVKLSKKYRSLAEDIKKFERLVTANPTGVGANFVIMHHAEAVKIVKARLACKFLRDHSIRVIYAYHEDTITFMYLETYFKGNKENEDRLRIEEYLKNLT